MNFKTLLHQCAEFAKLADQKIVLDPKKSNIAFWSKFLYNALVSYSQYLRSPQAAKTIFDNIAYYHANSATAPNTDYQQVNTILGAIEEAQNKLRQASVDPISVLQAAGMSNLNPNILDILIKNLQTLLEAKNFSSYQHFYLPRPGQPKDIIELDNQDVPGKNEAGY